MSHLDVLREVTERGLSLTVAGADLKLAGPRQRVDAGLVARIRAAKPELIAHLTASHTAREKGFGLTLLQRSYLIGRGDSIEIGNVASHVYHEVDGCWDVGKLESALRAVVARHGMLRTHFTDDGRQVTEPEADVRIERLDLRGDPGQQRKLDQLRAERSHRILPLDRAPMIAVEVTVLADDLMRLHVSTDGLVLDGISMFMFFIEWHREYVAGRPGSGGDDVPFADYVAALEAMAGTPAMRRSREYWLDRLETAAAPRPAAARQPGHDHHAEVHAVLRQPGRRAVGQAQGPGGGRRPHPDGGAARRLRGDAGQVGRWAQLHAHDHGGQPAADPSWHRQRARQLLPDAAGRARA